VFKINVNKDGDFVLEVFFPKMTLTIEGDEDVIEAIADILAMKHIYEGLKCESPKEEVERLPEKSKPEGKK